MRHFLHKFATAPIAKCLALLFATPIPGDSSTFDERAAEVIQHFAGVDYTLNATPKYTFFYAEAKFYDYEVNKVTSRLAEARAQVNAGLSNLNDKDPPFQLWRAVDCYLRYQHLYGDALKRKTKASLLRSPHYDYHNTQNKIWMAATARYLVSELWPEETVASGYSTSDPSGRATLLAKMESFVRTGATEHNSSTYFAMHYGPLRTLADFAKDPEIKNKAHLTAEFLLADAAAEWLDGLWCAPDQRIYPASAFTTPTTYAAGASTLRLYFGGPTPSNWNSELVDAVQAICSPYRPPKIFISIAQDRTTEYVHRETHYDVATYFYCTTYMTPEYALFSSHEEYSRWGRGGGMDHVQRWMVSFRRDNGYCTFFLLHPNSTKANHLGATEYEQVLQSKNALIGVSNIPKNNVVGHKGQNSSNRIRGWVPDNPDAKINEASTSGRIFLHYGNVMIALHLTSTFNWDGFSTVFTLPDRKLGLILEVVSPSSYAGTRAIEQLENFKSAFIANWDTRVNTAGINAPAPKLVYETLDGTRLETTYRETNKINNQTIEYTQEAWPLLSNPWIHQDFLGDKLTITYGDATRLYDFNNWTVSETDQSAPIIKTSPR